MSAVFLGLAYGGDLAEQKDSQAFDLRNIPVEASIHINMVHHHIAN